MIFLLMFMTVWSINLQILGMWQWRRYDFGDVIFHAQRVRTVYPILYKNRSPRKTKQDIHLIFSVFIYSNIVERINKVLKKTGNRPETTKSAPSPLKWTEYYRHERSFYNARNGPMYIFENFQPAVTVFSLTSHHVSLSSSTICVLLSKILSLRSAVNSSNLHMGSD